VQDSILRFFNVAPHKNLPHKLWHGYTGPKTKISRIFGEPITGNGKWLTKNSNPPGIHGANRNVKL
jgi:hypothetical protein